MATKITKSVLTKFIHEQVKKQINERFFFTESKLSPNAKILARSIDSGNSWDIFDNISKVRISSATKTTDNKFVFSINNKRIKSSSIEKILDYFEDRIAKEDEEFDEEI